MDLGDASTSDAVGYPAPRLRRIIMEPQDQAPILKNLETVNDGYDLSHSTDVLYTSNKTIEVAFKECRLGIFLLAPYLLFIAFVDGRDIPYVFYRPSCTSKKKCPSRKYTSNR